MDRVTLELVGNEIAITLRREVGQVARVRRIGTNDAFAMSLLLAAEPADQALNFETNAGVRLQIENRPYDRAWLFLDDRQGGQTLVACLEGEVIRQVGKALHHLHSISPSLADERNAFAISYCYLDE